jgi:hypothetical protein
LTSGARQQETPPAPASGVVSLDRTVGYGPEETVIVRVAV